MKNSFYIIVLSTLFTLLNCKQTHTLPIVSTHINEMGEKEVYTVSNFHFINQLGYDFTDKNTLGKVYIANFFFTSCPSICPKMSTVLIDISKSFKNTDDFMILSFTIDPKHDTLPKLYQYAQKTKISSKKWVLLRGTDTELNKMADFFRTYFTTNEDGADFYHSSFVALVDKQQRVRGYYNILDPKSVIQLKKDLKTIL